MGDQRAASEAALDRLIGPAGLIGAAIVSRDGLPVLARFGRPVHEETFAAMAAALFGAAEAAAQEVSQDHMMKATLETSGMRLVVVGLNADYLLVAAAPATLQPVQLSTHLDSAAKEIRAAVGG